MKIKRDNNANYNVTLSHIESNSKKLVVQLNTLNKVFRNYSKNDTDLLTITDSELKKSLISKEVLLLGLDDDLALTLCKNDSIYKSILSDIKKIKSTKDYFYQVNYFKMIDFKKGMYKLNYKKLESIVEGLVYFDVNDKHDIKIYDEIAVATDTLLKYFPHNKSAIFSALNKVLDSDLKPTYNTLKYLR